MNAIVVLYFLVGQIIITDSLALVCSTWNYGYTWKVESSEIDRQKVAVKEMTRSIEKNCLLKLVNDELQAKVRSIS